MGHRAIFQRRYWADIEQPTGSGNHGDPDEDDPRIGEVDAVARDEAPDPGEPDVIGTQVDQPAVRLVEERADPDGSRAARAELGAQGRQRLTRVDQVFHDEHVAALDGHRQRPGHAHVPRRFGPPAVARQSDEVDGHGQIELADQIRGEDERPP